MHTFASKVTARDREVVPQYYYRLSENTSWVQKIKIGVRGVLAFLLTEFGVIVLIVCYMLCGALAFHNIEADSWMDVATEAEKSRVNLTQQIWALTDKYNVLRPQLWRNQVTGLVMEFQEEVVLNVRRGYTGQAVGVRVWTFSSSLMYSMTIFTTIGYGNLTPCTSLGKVVTIMYALVGIPLMFIYMANIGTILASSFKYVYSKLCRCEQDPPDLPKQATLPAINIDKLSFGEEEITTSRASFCSQAFHGLIAERPSKVSSVTDFVTLQDKQWGNKNRQRKINQPKLNMKSMESVKRSENPEKEETVNVELVEDLSLVTIPITTSLLFLLSYILCGAALFSAWEGWTFLDGAYFCFTSLMTIGFGDFVPGNSYIYNVVDDMSEKEANFKLVFGSVYILLGMGILAMCINLVQEKISSQARDIAAAVVGKNND